MYHTFLFRLKSNLIASNVDTKDNTDTVLKIIETFVEQEVVSRILRSIGYDDVELLFQSSPYKTKKKWFQSIPVRVRTEEEIEEFVTSVKKPFANTLVPYRVYRETDQSSDSDTEYEEKNRYISLAQNASSEKYFIAVDPEIVRGLRFEWIPEFRVIERYPVSITRDNAHDSEIERRTNSGRYILLDCKTDTVAKKGVDFHLARFEEIQILAKNQQKVDLQIFLNNKTRKTDNAYVLVSVLHDTYEQWAKKHEKKSISLKEFSSFIEELGYEKKRMTSGMVILVTIVAFEPDEVADCTKAEVGAETESQRDRNANAKTDVCIDDEMTITTEELMRLIKKKSSVLSDDVSDISDDTDNDSEHTIDSTQKRSTHKRSTQSDKAKTDVCSDDEMSISTEELRHRYLHHFTFQTPTPKGRLILM